MWAVVDQMDPLVAVFMTCAWSVMLSAAGVILTVSEL